MFFTRKSTKVTAICLVGLIGVVTASITLLNFTNKTEAVPAYIPCDSGIPSLEISFATYDTATNGFTGKLTLGKVNENKEAKWPSNTVVLDNCTGEVVTDTKTEIKGRGNTSWEWPKKSYQIKFDKKTSVLGMPGAKKWVLLADFDDHTMLRNKTIFDFSRSIGLYAPRLEPIEVFMDGEYRGMYWLTEKVEPGADRVNITNKGDTSTNPGGVLMEIDNAYGRAEPNYQVISKGGIVVMKETVADDEGGTCTGNNTSIGCNAVRHAKTQIQTFENKLYSKAAFSEIEALIDVNSFAKYYVLTELAMNPDSYVSSTFLYSNGCSGGVCDKLHAGPLWDMSASLMISKKLQHFATDINHKFTCSQTLDASWSDRIDWMCLLIKYPQFQDAVRDVVNSVEFSNAAASASNKIAENSSIISTAKTNDSLKHNYVLEPIDSFQNFINTRLAYLQKVHGVDTTEAVFRVRNKYQGNYFYTTNYQEVINSVNKYGWGIYEGIAWWTDVKQSDKLPIHRVRNNQSGTYFYTSNWQEVLDAVYKYGWGIYEDVAWYAPKTSSTPIYRSRSAINNGYFYTTSYSEWQSTVYTYGWGILEGIGLYANN